MRQYNYYTVLFFKQIHSNLFAGRQKCSFKKKGKHWSFLAYCFRNNDLHWWHYIDYLCLRLCANQPVSPWFQSEHFWNVPNNTYVDISFYYTYHILGIISTKNDSLENWMIVTKQQPKNAILQYHLDLVWNTVHLHLLTF